ncbi:hypothetical protein CBOM_00231 [Ceraceosorus bombacis]|uniref:Uncharacterized protein n=1 Tax=Ceraceosorus bombacis TaxID=401625 RepID=A0A0P1B9H8_9BASI|nr:hypothetical protein CBOM_00231 [Ceraceosorus bombacis]
MADQEDVQLSEEHAPQERAIDAFTRLEPKIKQELLKSRAHWDAHEPRMYSKVSGVSDEDLSSFSSSKDLVAVRAGAVSYGTIIFGKIRLAKAGNDAYIHVRIHDPPGEEERDVVYHSLYTNELRSTPDAQPTDYIAIQSRSTPLDFFSE